MATATRSFSERRSEKERVAVAINASSNSFTAYHQDLNGQVTELLSDRELSVIGQGTKDALRKWGIVADYMPAHYDSVSLGKLLAQVCLDGARILLARSSMGDAMLVEELAKNPKISYTDLAIYDTIYVTAGTEVLRAVMGEDAFANDRKTEKEQKAGPCDVVEEDCFVKVVFTSSSTVEGFLNAATDFPCGRALAICIGEKTAKTAKEHGFWTVTADNATVEELVDCTLRIKDKGNLAQNGKISIPVYPG